MSRVVLATLLVLGLTALHPAAASAQLPPATPEQEAAGLTVADIQIEQVALEIMRGDTARMRAVVQDQDGKAVPGAQILIWSPSSVIRGQNLVRDDTIVVWGRQPGEANVFVFVRVPSDSANFQGLGGI